MSDSEDVSVNSSRESAEPNLGSNLSEVSNIKQQVSNKKISSKSHIVEGETHVKSILKNDSATKVFVTMIEMEIPNQSELLVAQSGGDKRGSVYENVDVTETSHVIIEEPEDDEDYENDTFHLAKDSALFSQVSRSTIITSPSVVCKQEDNPCKVVEVKAKEIVKASVTSTEQVVLPKKSDHEGPQTVEIVELIDDTETEAESSAADTDPEDKWPSPVAERKVDGSHKQRKSCLAPGEILAKRQKLASDEALKSIKFSGRNPEVEPEMMNIENDDECGRDSATTALLDAAGASLKKSLEKEKSPRLVFSYAVEPTETPPPTPFEHSATITSPLCLQMTDTVNRVEQATVKTFDKGIPKNVNTDSSKEVTLRKEVEVSKTYQIIGSIKTQGNELTRLTVPTIEDNDSFYGSDKETDDVVTFSEDEGHVDFDDDTSSSDNDFLSSLSQETEDTSLKVSGMCKLSM